IGCWRLMVRLPVSSGISKRVSRYICQEACPFVQRFTIEASEPDYAPRGAGEPPNGVEPLPGSISSSISSSTPPHPGTGSPSLIDLFRTALDEESWESFSRGSAIRRAGREGFARNAAVALGNWGDPSAVAPLAQGLKDSHPLVREHAAWALGQVGSSDAAASLRERLSEEEVPSVREQIERALEGPSPSGK
ncbi:MAG: HEAT repeat domain-containing protein, partial [Longimicrobiales bacterium]|nr:HEAT repeat domain-containing protein [Longimicrobiales bacterium]